MTRDYYPKEEASDSSSTPFLSDPSANSHGGRLSSKPHKSFFFFFFRHRIFTLSFITLLSTVNFSIYFKIPSTLWIYLTAILILLPTSILYDSLSLAQSKGNLKVWWTRSRVFWVSLEILALFLLCLPRLSDSSSSRTSEWFGSRPRPHDSSGASSLNYNLQNQTFFISANLYQSENILPQFTRNLIELSEVLGSENVFISIYESNSVDSTKSLLKDFDQRLTEIGIRHKIISDNVGKHKGVAQSGRIKFLANARNKAQNAFYEAFPENAVVDSSSSSSDSSMTSSSTFQQTNKFDKVLWLNDIVFETRDVLELLSTNGGGFDQACGMDFFPLGLYDT